ncbi:MAG: succinylglutamate desuccinylase/aspartoacylase family protein [Gemmatimonadota bacterium]|nr:succinylglutamate desuccinylase/aspartoacylase family protein [Gemmatimonadota bacterium]
MRRRDAAALRLRGSAARSAVAPAAPAALLVALFLAAPRPAAAQAEEGGDAGPADTAPFPTPAERAEWLAWTPADSVAPWLARLAERTAPGVRATVDTLVVLVPGDAPEGPPSGPPAVVSAIRLRAAAPGTAGHDPRAGRDPEGPLRVLVVGGQHGDERAGTEAALLLARDLAAGPPPGLLAALDVTVVPALNPVGMRAGTREDGRGVDPNRDHASLATPAVRALWARFAALEPHLVLDLHEMGPTPYEAQVGLPTHPNVDPELVLIGRYRLLPWVVRELARGNVRFHEYVAENPDPARAPGTAAPGTAAADTFASFAPLAADDARNAFALAGTLSLLLETASDREVRSLRVRTERLVLMARGFLGVAAGVAAELRAVTRRDLRTDPSPFLALAARYETDPERPVLRWLVWDERGRAVPREVERWRSRVTTLASLPLPGAWAILPAGRDLAELLARHGARVERLTAPVRLRVGTYGDDPRAPRFAERELPAGTWIVPAGQPAQRLVFTLVEPGSMDARGRDGSRGRGDAAAAAGVDTRAAGADPPVVRIEGPPPDLPTVPAFEGLP